MTGPSLTLQQADETMLSDVETLLARNDLPTADVRAKPDCFYVASQDGTTVGVGGFEQHGTAGLLRSVVVEASARGDGLGTELCGALESRAADAGIETLYLLTATAAGFFADRGYEAIEREAAPAGIRGTAEFTELCPDAATCMRKSLEP